MKKIWLLQFVANALIVIAFYEWLGIRDSRATQLILSFVLGAAIIGGTVFLHSHTFHIKPIKFAVLLAIFLLICWGLNMIPLGKFAIWLASTLTFKTRKPVSPDIVALTFYWIKAVILWIIVPLILLQRRSPKFWIQYIAVIVAAFLIPALLIHWTPYPKATWLQVTSFVLRFGVAYCLVTTGFVALWRFTSSGRPAPSQVRTVTLP